MYMLVTDSVLFFPMMPQAKKNIVNKTLKIKKGICLIFLNVNQKFVDLIADQTTHRCRLQNMKLTRQF